MKNFSPHPQPLSQPLDFARDKRERGVFLSALSGVLLALSFPKFNLWWLAWVALVPLFWVLSRSKNWKESLLCGLAFGITFFGIDLFWVTTLSRFVGWWGVLGWGALVIFQTLFILLFVYILHSIRNSKFVIRNWILVPVLWTAVEWLRAWGPFGVSGGVIGYSQVHFLPLIQIASFVSVYGVSFLVVLVNATLTEIIRKPATERRGFLIFVLILLVVVYIYGLFELRGSREVYSQASEHLKLSLIQPNIDQMDKMDPKKVLSVYEIHEQLTRQAAEEKPEIIIWPETAVFTYLLHDRVLFSRVKQLAVDTKTWLVLGTPHYDDKGTVYNSIVSISPSGEVVSRYDKQQLVPFGEYLPFRKLLYPLLKGVGYYDQEFNSNPKPELISAGEFKIAAAICFESTFPDLIRKRVKENTDFILTITNDAWFGNSSAPYFHLDTGIFRAVENRKYFVQVGNTGFSAVIDPYGRILKKSRLNQREVLSFEIPLP